MIIRKGASMWAADVTTSARASADGLDVDHAKWQTLTKLSQDTLGGNSAACCPFCKVVSITSQRCITIW